MTPDEFVQRCAGLAYLSESRFGAFALGMLAGEAVHERRTFPQELVEQADGCWSMAEVEMLEMRLEALRTGGLL